MRVLIRSTLCAGVLLGCASQGQAQVRGATPEVFAPGTISGPDGEGASAFTPDGKTVFFMRETGDAWRILESHRDGNRWSTPRVAPFAGRWSDFDPTMSPDGSFMLFVSNRPADDGGKPIDSVKSGKVYPGHGMNIWRVDRHGADWGKPVRLPDTINSSNSTFAPGIAANGDVYFIGRIVPEETFVPLRARYREGHYLAPERMALSEATIRDVAVAPDVSFVVFSIKPADAKTLRLAIAFRSGEGWGKPIDLGDAINSGTHNMGAQLGADHRSLYYYNDHRVDGVEAAWNNGNDNIWRVSLVPWLDAHAAAR